MGAVRRGRQMRQDHQLAVFDIGRIWRCWSTRNHLLAGWHYHFSMYANRSVIDCQGISDNNDADDDDGKVDLQLLMIMEMTMMRTTDMIDSLCVCACMCVFDCVFVSFICKCGSSPTCCSSILLFFVCAHPHSWNVTSVCICPRSPNLFCVLRSSQTPQSESPLCAYVSQQWDEHWARAKVCAYLL